mgnify:FL=1
MEKEYPGIHVREELIDSLSAKLMDPEFNAGMQVFVLPNLYGDILTDIAAEYQGALERPALPILAISMPCLKPSMGWGSILLSTIVPSMPILPA